MPVEPPPHRGERQPFGEHPFEHSAVHTLMLAGFPLQMKGFGARFTRMSRKFVAVKPPGPA